MDFYWNGSNGGLNMAINAMQVAADAEEAERKKRLINEANRRSEKTNAALAASAEANIA